MSKIEWKCPVCVKSEQCAIQKCSDLGLQQWKKNQIWNQNIISKSPSRPALGKCISFAEVFFSEDRVPVGTKSEAKKDSLSPLCWQLPRMHVYDKPRLNWKYRVKMGWAVWKQTKIKIISIEFKEIVTPKTENKYILNMKHCIRFCVTFSCETFMHFKRKGPSLLFY